MTLHAQTLQLVVLLLIAVCASRAILTLNRAPIIRGTRSLKHLLLAATMLIPIVELLSSAPASDTRLFVVMNITLGVVWILSIIPTPPLAPSIRPEQDLTPTRAYKALLLALFICTLLIPSAFVPFFVLVHLLNQSKFRLVSITEMEMPHTLSTLLCAAHLINLITPLDPTILLIALAASAGAHYTPSGLKKLRLDWARINRIENIADAARIQHNWSPLDRIPGASSLFARTAILSQSIVIAIESLALLAFIDQRALLILFSSLIVMHIAIFVTTGICFWKWTITLVGICLASTLLDQSFLLPSDPLNAMIILAAACAIPFALPTIPTLAWYDTPIAHRVTFTISDGTRSARITPYDVAPLDVILSQARHERYFESAPGALDSFGTCYHREPTLLLNTLSTSSTLTQSEKADRALAILAAHSTTHFSKGVMQQECTNFLAQLRENLTRRPVPAIFNHHIWNALPRPDRDLLRSILDSEAPKLIVERELLFRCAHTRSEYTIDRRSVRLTIHPTICRLEAPAPLSVSA